MTEPWRLAKSLETLRAQINTLALLRNKASDGTIGDAAHAATASDHNPNASGVVCAFDVTHDPAGGCDAEYLWHSLIAAKDVRVQYIIWNRQIANGDAVGANDAWAVRAYRGANQHTKHLHISVRSVAALYDDARPWSVGVTAMAMPTPLTPIAVGGGVVAIAGAWAWNALGWVGLAAVIVAGIGLAVLIFKARRKGK